MVGPVEKESWGDDEVRERRLGIKRASLDKAEAKAEKEKAGKGDDDKVRKGKGRGGGVLMFYLP